MTRFIRPLFLVGLALVAALLAATPALAGRTCEEREPKADEIRLALQTGLRVRETLDQSGAQVALIARAGQDVSRYQLKYTHIGFVWRDHPQGRWLVVHNLNQCGTAFSALFNEGLGNFFLDSPFSYDTLLLIPQPPVQAALHALFSSAGASRMHEASYNMLAYPFSTRYQNSNQWALETLALAVNAGQIQTRADAQAWLQREGFVPTTLGLGPLTRLGARSRANIAFDDHPNEKRFSSRIETVTVEAMTAFLERSGRVQRKIELPGGLAKP